MPRIIRIERRQGFLANILCFGKAAQTNKGIAEVIEERTVLQIELDGLFEGGDRPD